MRVISELLRLRNTPVSQDQHPMLPQQRENVMLLAGQVPRDNGIILAPKWRLQYLHLKLMLIGNVTHFQGTLNYFRPRHDFKCRETTSFLGFRLSFSLFHWKLLELLSIIMTISTDASTVSASPQLSFSFQIYFHEMSFLISALLDPMAETLRR